MPVIKQAIILAGGRGTRLGALCEHQPKPLMSVAGIPFLQHIVENLRRFGITDIVISVGYLGDQIEEYFSSGKQFGVDIRYVIEQEPLGTGGALAFAKPKLDSHFFVVNGDTLFDINFHDLALCHFNDHRLVSMALRRVEDSSRYGSIVLEDNTIVDFGEKQVGKEGIINGGVYIISRDALDLLPSAPCSLEHDLFPKLAQSRQLGGVVYDGFFIDIGIPESLRTAQKAVPSWKSKPAVFFDRDGVINVDNGYVHTEEDFQWIPGSRDAVKWVNDLGYYVFIITNQAGIGRGYYSERQFHQFRDWLDSRFIESGAHIDATYYCPHHPSEAKGHYRKQCSCRKPAAGMLLQAIERMEH